MVVIQVKYFESLNLGFDNINEKVMIGLRDIYLVELQVVVSN